MKPITLLAIAALLGLTLATPSAPSYAAAPGAMSGKGDWASRGYYQAAKQKQMKAGKMKNKP